MQNIRIDTLAQIVCPCSPLYSPSGKKLAYKLMIPELSENKYRSEMYLRENGDTRRLPEGDDSVSCLWLGEDTLLFSRIGVDGTTFYSMNVSDGKAEPYFTVPLPVFDAYRLDNGSFALMCQFDLRAGKRSAGWEEISEIPFWGSGRGIFAGYRNRIYIYDHAAGSFEPLTSETMQVEHMDVRGNTVAWAGPDYDSVYYARVGVYCRDMTSGGTKCLVEPGHIFVFGMGILDGCLVIAGSAEKQDDAWQPGDIFSVPLDGGELRMLADLKTMICFPTTGGDCALGGGRLCKNDGSLFYFLATEGYGNHVFGIDAQGNLSARLDDADSVDFFDVCGDRICWREFCPEHGPELCENGVQLTDLSGSFSAEYTVLKPEPLRFTDSDGVDIDGWVIKPAGFDAGGSYPGILDIHGGPRCMYGDVFFHEMQAEAASGYFVFFCNPRGSDGRDKAFGDLYGRYGSIDYRDIMEFTDAVLKRYPQLDSRRLGVSGGSYGGFMTNWIIGHTDRFAAASSQRSIANWVVNEYVSEIGYYWIGSEMGVTANEDVEKLWSFSPLKYAKNAVTPTLFIQSDEDYLCPAADAAAMFTALKRKGVDAKFCYFHGENHNLSRSGHIQNRLHRLEEIIGWFDKYLK